MKGGRKFYLTNLSTFTTYFNEPLTLRITYFTPNKSSFVIRKIQNFHSNILDDLIRFLTLLFVFESLVLETSHLSHDKNDGVTSLHLLLLAITAKSFIISLYQS